ncbi:hypothetical protein NY78_1482 [Desulfovibrio sp. TomC]|nr:hypothetical protein NY78_1482 [Desulfovibrio sp. TomC]
MRQEHRPDPGGGRNRLGMAKKTLPWGRFPYDILAKKRPRRRKGHYFLLSLLKKCLSCTMSGGNAFARPMTLRVGFSHLRQRDHRKRA